MKQSIEQKKSEIQLHKVELLAPAGSYECMRAAVNAGADAVYMGGSRFGARAFAENPEPTRSDCHAWSSSPNYHLLSLVCGITPADYGFKKIRIEPNLGSLKEAIGKVPHPAGNIYKTSAPANWFLRIFQALVFLLSGMYYCIQLYRSTIKCQQ